MPVGERPFMRDKSCSRCKIPKPLVEFCIDRKSRDGHHHCCKTCDNGPNRSQTNRVWSWQLRVRVFQHYDLRCACCGEDNLYFLQIDHIHGGGNRHRKSLNLSGHTFYRWLIRHNFPEEYRTLCANCNSAIGYWGFCPHNQDVQQLTFLCRAKNAEAPPD